MAVTNHKADGYTKIGWRVYFESCSQGDLVRFADSEGNDAVRLDQYHNCQFRYSCHHFLAYRFKKG